MRLLALKKYLLEVALAMLSSAQERVIHGMDSSQYERQFRGQRSAVAQCNESGFGRYCVQTGG